MEQQMYQCPKCGNTSYETDQFQATGGNFAKIFDVQIKNLSPSAAPTAAIRRFIGTRPPQAGTCWTF